MPETYGLQNTFTSLAFKDQLQTITLGEAVETIAGNARRDFRGIAAALHDISTILVMGYSSQGPAQANNLRDTFVELGLDITVKVALRRSSKNRARARRDGFTETAGTLVTPEAGLPTADVAVMLMSDQGLAEDGDRYLDLLPKNAVVCLAHGFYIGYLEAVKRRLRTDISVIGVCPKGLGPSVRALYVQGGGINVSFAVHQAPEDQEARVRDLAIGLARALGAPFVFQTTLADEWRSDLFGERAMLDAGIHAIVEVLYDWYVARGVAPDQAYLRTAESLAGPIAHTIFRHGLRGVYEQLAAADRPLFKRAYNAAYPILRDVMQKIYRDVSSGREILEVVADGLNDDPMLNVSATDMWQLANKIRQERRATTYDRIDPVTAGVYLAGVIAQVDKLQSEGHSWSEIINETILEAVESLLPYMRAQGISSMIDNCSVTARRGDRKWQPIIGNRCRLGILPELDKPRPTVGDPFKAFEKHQVHEVLEAFGAFRSPVTLIV